MINQPGRNVRDTIVFLIFQIVFFNCIFAQSIDCNVENKAFKSGEKLTYIVSYNWFIVYTEVGEALFTVEEKTINEKPLFKLAGYGATYRSWDWFFRVRDKYECFVDPVSMEPVLFNRHVREGSFRLNIRYRFDHSENKVYSKYKANEGSLQLDTILIEPCSYDVISTLYLVRNIDFSDYEIGDSVPVSVVLDREIWNLYFRYLGTETIKVKNLGYFDCIKLSVMLVEGTIFHEGEDMLVWITNDANRIPVYLESPILVGSVKVRFVYTG